MAKKGKKKSQFAGKTSADAKKRRTEGTSYGHLSLPKGVSVFKEVKGKNYFDILPYEVKEAKHPDRDDEMGKAIPGELWYKRPYKLHRNIGV